MLLYPLVSSSRFMCIFHFWYSSFLPLYLNLHVVTFLFSLESLPYYFLVLNVCWFIQLSFIWQCLFFTLILQVFFSLNIEFFCNRIFFFQCFKYILFFLTSITSNKKLIIIYIFLHEIFLFFWMFKNFRLLFSSFLQGWAWPLFQGFSLIWGHGFYFHRSPLSTWAAHWVVFFLPGQDSPFPPFPCPLESPPRFQGPWVKPKKTSVPSPQPPSRTHLSGNLPHKFQLLSQPRTYYLCLLSKRFAPLGLCLPVRQQERDTKQETRASWGSPPQFSSYIDYNTALPTGYLMFFVHLYDGFCQERRSSTLSWQEPKSIPRLCISYSFTEY